MLKTNKFWLFVIGIIIVFCTVAILFLCNTQGDNAYIYSDKELVAAIDLTAVREPYSITVENANSGFNIIGVDNGRICVEKADCKYGICVKQGFISKGLIPIVCLPNSLLIVIKSTSDIDGVVG